MSFLIDLIEAQLNDSNVEAIGQQIGATSSQTKTAISKSLPLLVSALSSHATSNTGLNFLTGMLDKNNDGSILDDLIGMITNQGSSASSPQGQEALDAILGSQRPAVENHIADKTGLDTSAIVKLLPLLAPIVMGALTKAQTSKDLNGSSLQEFLEKEKVSASAKNPEGLDFLTTLLDKNKDGSVVDDVVAMGMKSLGNLFGK